MPKLKTPESLAKMYADQCEVLNVCRADCHIPDFYPTNPQAEVLVFGRVPPTSIMGVCFDNSVPYLAFRKTHGTDWSAQLKSAYFSGRSDSQQWKRLAEPAQGE